MVGAHHASNHFRCSPLLLTQCAVVLARFSESLLPPNFVAGVQTALAAYVSSQLALSSIYVLIETLMLFSIYFQIPCRAGAVHAASRLELVVCLEAAPERRWACCFIPWARVVSFLRVRLSSTDVFYF